MKIIISRKISTSLNILLLIVFLFGCTQDPVLWKAKSDEMVISAFIANNPDQYSEFGKLLESAGLTGHPIHIKWKIIK